VRDLSHLPIRRPLNLVRKPEGHYSFGSKIPTAVSLMTLLRIKVVLLKLEGAVLVPLIL